jgi:hypothetical protein
VLRHLVDGPRAAEPSFQRALSFTESALGPRHPLVAVALENYAGALRGLNRKVEAKAFEQRAKAILQSEADRRRYSVDIDELRRGR